MVAEFIEYTATGRRKTAVARVRLKAGTGLTKVNGLKLEDYFGTEAVVNFIRQPLALTENVSNYDIFANICGGGKVGQAGALRHGISRALIQADVNTKDVLKSSGCLTRDQRMKERKKSGQPGARKRFQFSKR